MCVKCRLRGGERRCYALTVLYESGHARGQPDLNRRLLALMAAEETAAQGVWLRGEVLLTWCEDLEQRAWPV